MNPKSYSSSRHVTIILLLVLLAFALRVYRLAAPDFWFDEAATYVIAERGFWGNLMFARLSPSEHPPMYYWLVLTWLQIAGGGEFALRFFSLWFGVLFVVLSHRFARREFGKDIGLGVAVVATFSPFMFSYSQEARMYTLVPVLGLLAMESFLRAVRRQRLRDEMLFVVIALVGVATHYYFALIFPAIFFYGLVYWRTLHRQMLIRWCVLLFITCVSLLGWLWLSPGLFNSIVAAMTGSWVPPWYARIERVVPDIALGASSNLGLEPLVRLLALIVWIPVFYGIRFADSLRLEQATQARTLCLCVMVGTLMGVALLPQGVVGRHAALMVPAFLLALVLGLVELSRRGYLRSMFFGLAVMLVFVIGIHNQLNKDNGDWSVALAEVGHEAKTGDVIVSAQPYLWTVQTYYHRQPEVPIRYLPEQPVLMVAPPLAQLSTEQIVQFIQTIHNQYQRIWLRPTSNGTNDPQQVMAHWLTQERFAAQVSYHRSASFGLFVKGAAENQALASAANFGDRIQLAVALINTTTLSVGDFLLTDLRWQTSAPIAADYLVGLKLVDTRGEVWAEQNILPCGGILFDV